MIRIGRRNFLSGLGGLLVALPFLEGLAPRTARADEDRRFFLFFRQWFGVQQRPRFPTGYNSEPEGFWPDVDLAPGKSEKLTKELLLRTPNGALRATGRLADFAGSLTMLRGVRLMDLSVVLHRQNLVQVTSGSRFQNTRPGFPADDANNAWPMHETIDTLIARQLDGSRPVVFESVINNSQTSYHNGDNPGDLPYENPTMKQPSAAYASLFTKASLDAKAQALRTYATTAVHDEIKRLRVDPRLSADDRIRLDQHFEAMREIEVAVNCNLPSGNDPLLASMQDADLVKSSDLGLPPDQQMRRWQARGNFNEYIESSADAFIRIAALGIACGAFRVGNIVMNDFSNYDHTSVFEAGSGDYNQGFPGHYHSLSHRSFNDTSDNTAGDAAVSAHHRIDHWHGRQFAKLLGLLRDYGVLDHGITMWSNEVSFGNHWAYDMPYILAGNAGGRLRSGQIIDLQSQAVSPDDAGDDGKIKAAIMNKQVPCSKVLNTVGAALGARSDDQQPLHDFGGLQRDLPRVTGNLPDLLNLG